MVEMRTYLSAPQVALISLTDRATTRSKEYLINDGAIMIVLFKKICGREYLLVENVCDNNGLHGLLGHSRTSIYKSYHSKDEPVVISNLFLGATILSINSVSIVHGKVVDLRTAC